MNKMLSLTLTALLLAGLSTLARSNDVFLPPAPVPSARQLKWHEMEVYGLLHFSLNTYTDKEWGFGNEDPKIFNLLLALASANVETPQKAATTAVLPPKYEGNKKP